jgi:hypothetical protein
MPACPRRVLSVSYVSDDSRPCLPERNSVNMKENDTLSDRVDQFGRSHPRLMLLATGTLMVIVTLALLTSTESPVVLYQAF